MKYTDAVELREGWRFQTTNAAGCEQPDFDDSDFLQVSVPHDWQIANRRDPDMEWGWSQGYFPRNQTGWYRRTIHVPEAWKGKRIWLMLDGCQRFYRIYVNGEKAGGHRFGYVPYLLDLTEKLQTGDNLLAVQVNAEQTLGDRWYSGAGLYRRVRLLVKDPVHIRPLTLQADAKPAGNGGTVDVSALLEGPVKAGVSVCALLTDSEGRTVGEGETIAEDDSFHLQIRAEHVRLWDLDDPCLYTLTVTLQSDGRETDRITEHVGFRSFSFSGSEGFFLNGRNRKLYGADLHHDYGLCFGAAVQDEVLRRRLRRLKELGCNAIRCSHNPMDESLYDLCDELGMAVIDELYDKWDRSKEYFSRLFGEDRFDDLRMMVARDRNHPSIILWSVGNEVEIQYEESFYRYLKEFRDELRRLDPSRPMSAALIGFVIKGYDEDAPLKKKVDAVLRYADIVDVFMGNYMENFYEAFRNAGMNKAVIGSEVFTYYRLEDLTTANTVCQSPWRDVLEKPYVAGGFVWAGVDYIGESMGWPVYGWTGCPLDSAGFRKLRSWYIQSQWTSAPMIRIGIYDDRAYDDHANPNWGFPLMTEQWRGFRESLLKHVAVMTNCPEVRLTLNGDHPRYGKPGQDGMVHFMVQFHPGILKAEGLQDGKTMACQELKTSKGPARMEAVRFGDEKITPGGLVQIELFLKDEYDQLWTAPGTEVMVTVHGNGRLEGLDNGDFLSEENRHGKIIHFHLGHAIAYVRATGNGGITVSAEAADIPGVSLEF